MMHTLHESRELNDPGELFEPVRQKPSDADMIGLVVQLIERQDGDYDPADFEDCYETRFRALIAAKASGKDLKQPVALPAPDNVIDLMAALKRSLAGDAPELPAKKAAVKPAARASKRAARRA